MKKFFGSNLYKIKNVDSVDQRSVQSDPALRWQQKASCVVKKEFTR